MFDYLVFLPLDKIEILKVDIHSIWWLRTFLSQILIPFTKFHFTKIFQFVFVRPTQKLVRGWDLGHCGSANLQDRGAQGDDATCLEWLSLSSFSFKFHFKNKNIKYSMYFNSCLKKNMLHTALIRIWIDIKSYRCTLKRES